MDRAGAAAARRPRSRYERRVLLAAALSALPFVLLALSLLLGFQPDAPAAAAWMLVAVLAWLAALRLLKHTVSYPLRTVATLLEALREGDYLLRGRLASPEDALGEVVREVNLLRDTLARQRMQVQETVALLRKVIESVDMAVYTFGPDGTLRLVNAAGRRLAGISTLGTEARDAAALGLAEFLEGGPARIVEREFPGAAGRWDIRHRAFRENGGTHHLLVISDLSRVLREEERSAWQRLIRVLGHEINNSLTPIQSISETLRGRLAGDGDADIARGLALIGARAEALQRFIHGYTLLARLPEPARQEFDLAELAARVAALEARTPVRCSGSRLVMAGDPAQIEQALINLVRNAVEAIGEEGEVQLRWRREGTAVLVDVEDNGPGLPDSENLFVPFFTTKASGNGIGLVLSRRIAEAHGGALTLANLPRGGCRARLKLPAQ